MAAPLVSPKSLVRVDAGLWSATPVKEATSSETCSLFLGNSSDLCRAARFLKANHSANVFYRGFKSEVRKRVTVAAATSTDLAAKPGKFIPASKILLPEGPWTEIPGGVTAAEGFRAAGLYGGLRAAGQKPDLALVVSDNDAIVAGAFTKNIMAAAPVLYCKKILAESSTARGVLINAGQANAATGEQGYQDTLDSAEAIAKILGVPVGSILIESTGVIGQRIKKEALLTALPKLTASLSNDIEGSDAAAVAITTTDLVSKSVAVETKVGKSLVRVGGIAKGSGMIHPNMATLLGVLTCDAHVAVDAWRPMVLKAVNRSFNQITVDGDSSTNDTLLAFANGASGGELVSDPDSAEALELQAALDAVLQSLAKAIASDGEGATCLIEVSVRGAGSEEAAATVARSVAASSLTKAAVYGRDPNWGRIACAAGYAGVPFDPSNLEICLGEFLLMKGGQPQPFDRVAASNYLRSTGDVHGTVALNISIGDGGGQSKAWGCDLSYDYVKINAEYTT